MLTDFKLGKNYPCAEHVTRCSASLDQNRPEIEIRQICYL